MLQNSLQETLKLISFPETFRDKDKAKGEIVALRIKEKKKKGELACQRSVAVSLQVRRAFQTPGSCVSFSFVFLCVCMCFLRFRFKRKQGTMRSGLITILRIVRSDRGSHGSLLFSHRAILKAKRTVKMSSSRFSRSNRTVQSRFQNLAFVIKEHRGFI